MKIPGFIIIFTLCLLFNVAAQTNKTDRALIRKAKIDVRRFRLTGTLWKQFKKKQFDTTSDYFKPVLENVSNAALLNDSVYVKKYRELAYKKTVHRHTAGHYLLIYGTIAVVVTVILAAVTVSELNFGTNY